jgi:hypothetical protein
VSMRSSLCVLNTSLLSVSPFNDQRASLRLRVQPQHRAGPEPGARHSQGFLLAASESIIPFHVCERHWLAGLKRPFEGSFFK